MELQKNDAVRKEFERRKEMFQRLNEKNLDKKGLLVDSNLIRKVGVYDGRRGIYRDFKNTVHLEGNGVTVSILHAGNRYDDKMDKGKYCYPDGKRKADDQEDIQATKNSYILRLPIFVISKKKGNLMKVEVGFIDGWDDDNKFFKFSTRQE